MDMSTIMQQAQQMQQNMARIQEELARKKVTGTAGWRHGYGYGQWQG